MKCRDCTGERFGDNKVEWRWDLKPEPHHIAWLCDPHHKRLMNNGLDYAKFWRWTRLGEESSEVVAKLCDCDMIVLLRGGCKCGGR
jgi:hypothetical protein